MFSSSNGVMGSDPLKIEKVWYCVVCGFVITKNLPTFLFGVMGSDPLKIEKVWYCVVCGFVITKNLPTFLFEKVCLFFYTKNIRHLQHFFF